MPPFFQLGNLSDWGRSQNPGAYTWEGSAYENQDAPNAEGLPLCRELGFDVDRFQADRQGEECARRVGQDFLGRARSGVHGTPTFFIASARHDGPHDFPSLAAALEQAAEES